MKGQDGNSDDSGEDEYGGGGSPKSPDLTPAVSKHFDNIHKLYLEELDILKKSLKYCQAKEREIVPQFDKQEEKLFRNFSRSPSPGNKLNINTDGDEEEEM